MNSQVRANAAPYESYPDAKGRYGSFGGRYLVEALERGDDVKAFLGSLR
jgi:hypothetical protein